MYIRSFDEKSPFVYSSDFLFDETLTTWVCRYRGSNPDSLQASKANGLPAVFSDKHYLYPQWGNTYIHVARFQPLKRTWLQYFIANYAFIHVEYAFDFTEEGTILLLKKQHKESSFQTSFQFHLN